MLLSFYQTIENIKGHVFFFLLLILMSIVSFLTMIQCYNLMKFPIIYERIDCDWLTFEILFPLNLKNNKNREHKQNALISFLFHYLMINIPIIKWLISPSSSNDCFPYQQMINFPIIKLLNFPLFSEYYSFSIVIFMIF